MICMMVQRLCLGVNYSTGKEHAQRKGINSRVFARLSTQAQSYELGDS